MKKLIPNLTIALSAMTLTFFIIDKFNEYNYGTACAIAMVLLVLVLSVTIIQFRMEKKFSAD